MHVVLDLQLRQKMGRAHKSGLATETNKKVGPSITCQGCSRTCNYDKKGLGPSCVSRMDLQLAQEKKTGTPIICRGWELQPGQKCQCPQLRFEGGHATRKKWVGPSCTSRVELQLRWICCPQLHTDCGLALGSKIGARPKLQLDVRSTIGLATRTKMSWAPVAGQWWTCNWDKKKSKCPNYMLGWSWNRDKNGRLPLACRGWTCSWDKNGSDPNCISRVKLKLWKNWSGP